MRIGIFGGSFNPVHLGHFEIVHQLLKLRLVDRVMVIPAAHNPLKENHPQLSGSLRARLLQATFGELSEVEVSLCELQRGGLSYSYQTLEEISALYPQDRLYLILGEDSFAQFPYWKNKARIFELAEILVFNRKGKSNASSRPQLSLKEAKKVHWVEVEIPEVSSTEIRTQSLSERKLASRLHPKAAKLWLKEAQKE